MHPGEPNTFVVKAFHALTMGPKTKDCRDRSDMRLRL
jgi:hypothetical protein